MERGYEIHVMIEKDGESLDMYHMVMLGNHFIAMKICSLCKMRVFLKTYVVGNSLLGMYDKCSLVANVT